ncbi:MAG: MFS transporter [Thermodesulfobacteriota bacterium]
MIKNKSVIALNISVFLLMIGVGLIVALLPQRIMKLSASITEVGLLASIYAIPNVLLQIPIGNLSDRWGYKSFLVGGYLLCGLTGCLYFFADTPTVFLGGRFLQGMAEVPIWALAPALLSRQYTSAKGKFMGIYNASLHCGLAVGSLISVIIYRIWQGNEPFMLFAVVSVLSGLLTALFVENPDQKPGYRAATVDAGNIWSLLANGANLLVFFGITLYGAGYGVFITVVPAFLISNKDVAQTTISVFFAIFYTAVGLAQLLSGTWSDRRGRKPAMLFGLLIAALGLATFHNCKYPFFMGLLALASLGLGIFCVSSMAYLNERVSEAVKGTISGAFYFFWGTGYFIGPLLLGKLGHSENWAVGFSGLAGLFMIELMACLVSIKNTTKALDVD